MSGTTSHLSDGHLKAYSDGSRMIGNTRAIIRAATVLSLRNVIFDFINVLILAISLSSAILTIVARSTIV